MDGEREVPDKENRFYKFNQDEGCLYASCQYFSHCQEANEKVLDILCIKRPKVYIAPVLAKDSGEKELMCLSYKEKKEDIDGRKK